MSVIEISQLTCSATRNDEPNLLAYLTMEVFDGTGTLPLQQVASLRARPAEFFAGRQQKQTTPTHSCRIDWVANERQQRYQALGYGDDNNTRSFDPFWRGSYNSFATSSISAMRSTADNGSYAYPAAASDHRRFEQPALFPTRPSVGRRRIAISDLVLDMDVDMVPFATDEFTAHSSSATSSPSLYDRPSARPTAQYKGGHTAGQSYGSPPPMDILFAGDLAFKRISETTGDPAQAHATQPNVKKQTRVATTIPRARTPAKKAAAGPTSRKRSQTVATTASKTRRKKTQMKTKGARTEAERIVDMKANRWVMQFGVIHAVCAGCGSRFKNDKRSRFYPGLIEKHARTCPGVKRKKAEMALQKKHGEDIEDRERVWIYMKNEETYILAKEDGAAAEIVPGKETTSKTTTKDAKVVVEPSLPDEDDELESDDDDEEYVPTRIAYSCRV